MKKNYLIAILLFLFCCFKTLAATIAIEGDISNDYVTSDDEVYEYSKVKTKPTFKKKDFLKFSDYIYARIRYPDDALLCKIEGTAVFSFVIEKDGSIVDVNVIKPIIDMAGDKDIVVSVPNKSNRSMNNTNKVTYTNRRFTPRMRNKIINDFEEYIICIISRAKGITPGYLDGVPVRVKYTVPITLKLR